MWIFGYNTYIGDGSREPGNRLLNLLTELFKSDDNARTKLGKLKENYLIDLNQDEEGMVDTMCNLSVGVYERCWDKAWSKACNESLQRERAMKKRLVSNLWEMRMDIPVIARLAECSEEEVIEIAKEMNLV